MKCEFGFCLTCEKEIVDKCPACTSRRPSDQYTEIELEWSNGAKMKTAVCIDCSKGPAFQADKKAMTEAVWKAWDKHGGGYDRAVVLV